MHNGRENRGYQATSAMNAPGTHLARALGGGFMAKQPSDIAPEVPELQRENRERHPAADPADKADERAKRGATLEDDDKASEAPLNPDAQHDV